MNLTKKYLFPLVLLILISSCTMGGNSPIESFRADISQPKSITSFMFTSPFVCGEISDNEIFVNVYDANKTSLIAHFTNSAGSVVKIGSDVQTSGSTSNDFNSTLVYTVVAIDGSTQNYSVTVRDDPYSLNLSTNPSDKNGPAGGYIFYINTTPEIDGWKYLEVAPEIIPGKLWGTMGNTILAANQTDIGTGRQNSLNIFCNDLLEDNAAQICIEFELNGYDDWFLPSKDELTVLQSNSAINGAYMNGGQYLSSSQNTNNTIWSMRMLDGLWNSGELKSQLRTFRPIRMF